MIFSTPNFFLVPPERRASILADLLASIRLPACGHNPRPQVTLSYAQSLDGSIAMNRGTPYLLSGSESQIITHKLRAVHDGILVGINTVIADNPSLTVRLVKGPSPLPVILDSHLRLPLNSNLLKNKELPLIATTTSANREKQERLEQIGAKIVRLPADERGWVDLPSLLKILPRYGIQSLMVEGGARVITSFLSQRLVDRVVITIAPTLLGGLHAVENPLISGSPKSRDENSLPQFSDSGYEQVGKDLIFWSALSWANQ
jgi:riboflavin-specific deaminase-like protein